MWYIYEGENLALVIQSKRCSLVMFLSDRVVVELRCQSWDFMTFAALYCSTVTRGQ